MEKLAGLNINGKIINNLTSADDTVLLAQNGQELQGLVDHVKMNSAECGLDINIIDISNQSLGTLGIHIASRSPRKFRKV